MSAKDVAKNDLAECKFLARGQKKKELIDKEEFSVYGCHSMFVRTFQTLSEALDYVDYLMGKAEDDCYYVVRIEKTMVAYAERKKEDN